MRGGTIFLRTGNGVFVTDDRFFIRATTEPLGFRWSDREGNTIDYDATGRMTGYADGNGVRISVDRDGQGRITTVRDHAGQVALTLTWSGTQFTGVTDRAGRSVVYTWTSGNLTAVRDLRGSTWGFGYDNNGRITSITDPLDRAWTVVYHQSFRVGGAGAPSGVSTSGRPPRDFRVSSVRTLTAPGGAVWRYEYAYNRERRQWSARILIQVGTAI